MKIKIAVLSDLHAFQKSRSSKDSSREPLVSYLPAHPEPSDPKPFEDLNNLISRDSLVADLVVCPGDICDRGDIGGFGYAWDQLHLLKQKLRAGHLIATCGNHDLDSRYASTGSVDDPDPKGNLLQASPPFPFGDTAETNQYWARNFALLRPAEDVRLLVLNTSAYHGGKESELEHGRISNRTIEAIRAAWTAP